MDRRYSLRYFFFLLLFFVGCQGTRPTSLGITSEGRLLPCPDKPNCVVSYDKEKDSDHYIEPIEIHSNKETAYKKLISILETSKGASIIKKDERYIYAEFTSSLFKFVDDVEFLFSDNSKHIHVRSASRLGKSDFSANKDRIEKIRFRFQQNDYKK